MRTREEILQELDSLTEGKSVNIASVAYQMAQMEVLLDIRGLLAEPPIINSIEET